MHLVPNVKLPGPVRPFAFMARPESFGTFKDIHEMEIIKLKKDNNCSNLELPVPQANRLLPE